MELISINVSQPVNIHHNGRRMATSIFKKSVEGRVWVRKENIEGDRQVDLKNHGGEFKAVYGFASDHYAYWRDVLHSADLKPGAFGENLTISGLDESRLCIGDRLSIGECVLEISQPRVPCFKLGLALGNKNMPRLFTKHFYTGVYFRVVEEGQIEKGDEVLVSQSHPDQLSLKTLFQAYFDKAFENPLPVFERALSNEALSTEWRDKLLNKMESRP